MWCALAYSTPCIRSGPASIDGWLGTMFVDAIPSATRSRETLTVAGCALATVTKSALQNEQANKIRTRIGHCARQPGRAAGADWIARCGPHDRRRPKCETAGWVTMTL